MEYRILTQSPKGAVLSDPITAPACVIDVPYINQSERWPTGCESVSTVMMLRHLGLDLPVDDFLQELPMQDFCGKNGVTYGADPARSFVGSPYDPDAYGCYAPVIAAALNRVFAKIAPQFEAVEVTGTPLAVLKREQLDRGMPVIFWATIDLLPSRQGPAWMVEDPAGDYEYRWISNEHCLLLVGCDDDLCWFNDPWHSHGLIAADRQLVEQRHAEMKSMCVIVRRLGSAD